MSDIGADVFAEWGVVPENVVPLSVFSVVSRGWLVVECIGIRIRRVPFGMAEDALSDERDDSPPRELPPTIHHKEHTGQHQQKTVVPFILQSILRPSRSASLKHTSDLLIYIYIYIYIGSLQVDFRVEQCSIH